MKKILVLFSAILLFPSVIFSLELTPIYSLSLGEGIRKLVADDIDNDGLIEIVCIAHTDQYVADLVVFESDGQSLVEVWRESSRPYFSLYIEDIDQDGKKEIITGTTYSDFSLYVFESTGNNSFVEVWNSGNLLNSYYSVDAIAVADTDNDGRNDIIVGSERYSRISVFENIGDNSYNMVFSESLPTNIFLPAVGNIEIGNLDGDNLPDIAVTLNASPPDASPPKLMIIESVGDNLYQDVFIAEQPVVKNWTYGLALGDFDKDLLPDIAITTFNDFKMRIFENRGDNQYTEIWDSGSTMGNESYDISSFDLNSNGNPEIITESRDGKVYIFEAIGDDSYAKVWDSGALITDMVQGTNTVADVTYDGNPNLIVGTVGTQWTQGSIYIFDVIKLETASVPVHQGWWVTLSVFTGIYILYRRKVLHIW